MAAHEVDERIKREQELVPHVASEGEPLHILHDSVEFVAVNDENAPAIRGAMNGALLAYVKKRVKDAVNFIGKFEEAVVKYAEKYSVDAVLCGHIHSAAIHKFGNVTYYNCGDWVETCCALVERENGEIEIVNYGEFLSAAGPPRSLQVAIV